MQSSLGEVHLKMIINHNINPFNQHPNDNSILDAEAVGVLGNGDCFYISLLYAVFCESSDLFERIIQAAGAAVDDGSTSTRESLFNKFFGVTESRHLFLKKIGVISWLRKRVVEEIISNLELFKDYNKFADGKSGACIVNCFSC